MSQRTPTDHEIDVYCTAYITNGGDQTKAWRVTYPGSTADSDTTWVRASQMHKMSKVLVRLEELQQSQALKDEEEFDLSVSELKETLKSVITAGLSEKVDKDGNMIPVNLAAAVSAVAEVNRMNGNHAATKQEITGKNGGALELSNVTERELARRMAFALTKGAIEHEDEPSEKSSRPLRIAK